MLQVRSSVRRQVQKGGLVGRPNRNHRKKNTNLVKRWLANIYFEVLHTRCLIGKDVIKLRSQPTLTLTLILTLGITYFCQFRSNSTSL